MSAVNQKVQLCFQFASCYPESGSLVSVRKTEFEALKQYELSLVRYLFSIVCFDKCCIAEVRADSNFFNFALLKSE